MEMLSHKVVVEPVSEKTFSFLVEVAAVNMLKEELKRPELIHFPQLRNLGRRMLQDGTAFIALQDGVPVGALGSLLLPNVFNPEITTLAEVMWYVLPEARHTRAGALLLKAFQEKAEQVADEATLSLLGSSEVNMKTLEKRGFMLSEFAFRKQIRRT